MSAWVIVLGTVAVFIGLGGVPFVIWFYNCRWVINRPDAERRINGTKSKCLVVGDSIAAGYGPPDVSNFASLIADDRKCTVDILTKPFAGITAVPQLLGLLKGLHYDAIVLSAGGNDVMKGSSKTIEAELRETIRLARTLTDNLIVLINIHGLGQMFPVWLLRLIFRWRAKKIQKIYTEVLNELSVTAINITDICVDPKNLAQDGLHPNGRAHKAIFDRFKHLL